MIIVPQGNCNEIVLKIFIGNARDPCKIFRNQKPCDGEGLGARGIFLNVNMLTADPVGNIIEEV